MYNKIKKISTYVFLATFSNTIVHAQDLSKIELTNKIDVLNEKVFFNFPQKAEKSPRSVSIMAASPNDNGETRITYDMDNKRVVFLAKNLFKIGNKNLFDEINKSKDEILTYKRKVLIDKDSIYAVLSTPITFNTEGSGMLVNRLIVKTQDNTLFEILAYISPEAYSQKADYIAFTENIFKTLTKGNRTDNLNARTEDIQLELNYSYHVDLPANYGYIQDENYDFKVTTINKYTPFNGGTAEIIIYSGKYPTLFYRKLKFTKEDDIITKGLFLRQEINWHNYNNENRKEFLREEVIEISNDMIHIAMISDSQENINELTKIVESIKYIKN